MPQTPSLTVAVGLVWGTAACGIAADPVAPLEIVRANCLDCHSGDDPQGAVALDRLLAAPDLARDFRTWQAVREQIEAARMPPREAGELTAADREALLGWLAPGLRAAIEARYPHHGIRGEELGIARGEAEHLWVLDPIDGTRSFITGKAPGRAISTAQAWVLGSAPNATDARLKILLCVESWVCVSKPMTTS